MKKGDSRNTNELNSTYNNSSSANRLWVISVVILSAFFAFCAVTYLVTPIFMVHPTHDQDAAEALRSYDNVQPIEIPYDNDKTEASKLSGYILDRPEADDLIIWFGGISDNAAGTVLDLIENPAYAGSCFEDNDIAVVDWPGYGLSDGKATDNSLRRSAVIITDYFCSIRSGNVFIIAYSMGTGPAVYAASLCSCDGLVLIAPYASSDDLYNSVTNIFYGPLRSLLSYHMDTYIYAADVYERSLIIACTSDRRVPFESSQRLAAYFPGSVSMVTLDDISHGDLPSDSSVLDAISQFLEK